MLTYYPHLSPADNLLCVLRWITSDGILTVEEVWGLADWLNKHREATESWPGSALVPYLQIIWADGVLDASEVSGLQSLIASIEKEVADKRGTASESPSDDSTRPSSKIIILLPPFTLPLINHMTTVRSSGGFGEYSIDMSGPSCTCPDWMERRRDQPQGSLGRACKHIVHTIFDLGIYRQFPEPFWAVLNSCHLRSGGTGPNDEYVRIDVKDRKFIACYGNGEWVNVVEIRGGDCDRFGYNLVQKRWAYGESSKRGQRTSCRHSRNVARHTVDRGHRPCFFESQGDSALKPRVGPTTEGLPWVHRDIMTTTSTRLRPENERRSTTHAATPFGVEGFHIIAFPR